MIDWMRVTELRDEIGKENFADVIELFIDEMDGAMSSLGDGSSGLEEQLHFLKGGALSIGFSEFAIKCQQGETNAREGRENQIDLGRIRSHYDQSRTSLLTELPLRFT